MKEEYISMQSLEKISKFDKQVKITINDKEYYCDDEILKLIMRNQDKIELLEYNRDKAIEELDKYINRCTNENGSDYDVCLMALNCLKKAKSILRGEENE